MVSTAHYHNDMSFYTTYSRPSVCSKTLFHIANDEFQVLHNGEPGEVLDTTPASYIVRCEV
jgi:hypothetical protein